MKEKGFSNFISLLIILSLHGVILGFVFSTGLFVKSCLHREWTIKGRAFQEKSIKEIIEEWMDRASKIEDTAKIFEKISKKGKDGDFNFETILKFEELEGYGNVIPFRFTAISTTVRGKYESKTLLEGEGRFFKGGIPLSIFPILSESKDSLSEAKVFSHLLPKEKFSFPFSINLNFNDELKEKIKDSSEGIFYFDSLEEPVLFFNGNVDRIEFAREFDFQVVNIIFDGKKVSLRIGKGSSIFQNYDGALISSKQCKLIIINGKIESINSSEDYVLIPCLDLTIISSGSINIEKSIDGANSLLGICSVGFDLISGEEKESFIRISQNVCSIHASLLSAGNIEIEGELIVKGSLQAKKINFKNLKIFVQDYLISGINPAFYPSSAEDSIFIGKLNIEEWREE